MYTFPVAIVLAARIAYKQYVEAAAAAIRFLPNEDYLQWFFFSRALSFSETSPSQMYPSLFYQQWLRLFFCPSAIRLISPVAAIPFTSRTHSAEIYAALHSRRDAMKRMSRMNWNKVLRQRARLKVKWVFVVISKLDRYSLARAHAAHK